MLAAGPIQAMAQSANFADLSIEELATIPVTSVSRRPEPLAAAAASIYVITGEAIHRAGARSLAEALRLAPNLQVAEGANGGYGISARGMNGSLNSSPNKLLVLIDGRSVYSPLFSGVFWDAQEVVLEDVERIEVISGPGGTLWGVNAVNGVINVITRRAQDTAGVLTSVAAGTRGADSLARYGAGNWRAWAQGSMEGHTVLDSGAAVADRRFFGQAGLRGDWSAGNDSLFLNGQLYHTHIGQPEPGAISVAGSELALGEITSSGANLTGSWTRAFAGGGSLSVQGYLDHTQRTVPPTFAERLDIADLQLQHALAPHGAHRLVWGANVRTSRDAVTNSAIIAFLPAHTSQHWTALFAQDAIDLAPTLTAIVGARAERNPYTGLEWLPTLRLAYQPEASQLWWGALSRTVRAPSRLDVDAYIPGAPPFLLNGGRRLVAEVAQVAEAGVRLQPSDRFTVAATLFHNRYAHLRTQEIDPSYTFVEFANKMHGQATGLEAWATWQAAPSWRLALGGNALHERFVADPDSNDADSPHTSGFDPAYTLRLRSEWDLGAGRELSVGLRRVARLSNPDVPAYTAIDARLAWHLSPQAEVALVGQNLNGAHAEYGPLATRSRIGRALSVQLTFKR